MKTDAFSIIKSNNIEHANLDEMNFSNYNNFPLILILILVSWFSKKKYLG